MSEFSEAAADVISTLKAAGAGSSVTITRRELGALDLTTGERSEFHDPMTLDALTPSAEDLRLSTGSFSVEAGRVAYYVATADLAFTPEKHDEVADGANVYLVSEVREAMGGHVTVIICTDQEVT